MDGSHHQGQGDQCRMGKRLEPATARSHDYPSTCREREEPLQGSGERTGLPGRDQGLQKRNPSATNPQPGGKGPGEHKYRLSLSSHSPTSCLHWPNPSGSRWQGTQLLGIDQGGEGWRVCLGGTRSRSSVAFVIQPELGLESGPLPVLPVTVHQVRRASGPLGAGGFSSFSLVCVHPEAMREPWRERAEKIRGPIGSCERSNWRQCSECLVRS